MSLFADSERLASGWYAACKMSDIACGKKYTVSLGSHPILLLRDNTGLISAMKNTCPHLGAKLSRGTWDGRSKMVCCAFHGWKINPQGEVVDSGMHACSSRRALVFQTRESHGLIWIYLDSKNGNKSPLPDFLQEDLKRLHGMSWKALRPKKLKCHPHWVLGNGLDIAHFHQVHQIQHDTPPRFELDSLGRACVHLHGRPRQKWLRSVIGIKSEGVKTRFTAWGAGSCGLFFESPIIFAVVFAAYADENGHARTQVSLALPKGASKWRAIILLLSILYRDKQLLEGSVLQPNFCEEADQAIESYVAMIDAAGEADL